MKGSHAKKCKAHSSQTGKPCKRWAIAGGTVCPTHGGSAPQVQASAAERLALLACPAVDEVARVMRKSKSDKARLTAAVAVLDRTGHGRTMSINLRSLGMLADALGQLNEEQQDQLAQLLEARR